ncbi:MAG: hypothetical protein ACREOW_10240 [Thermodesulfobacteriota bacterium]
MKPWKDLKKILIVATFGFMATAGIVRAYEFDPGITKKPYKLGLIEGWGFCLIELTTTGYCSADTAKKACADGYKWLKERKEGEGVDLSEVKGNPLYKGKYLKACIYGYKRKCKERDWEPADEDLPSLFKRLWKESE